MLGIEFLYKIKEGTYICSCIVHAAHKNPSSSSRTLKYQYETKYKYFRHKNNDRYARSISVSHGLLTYTRKKLNQCLRLIRLNNN